MSDPLKLLLAEILHDEISDVLYGLRDIAYLDQKSKTWKLIFPSGKSETFDSHKVANLLVEHITDYLSATETETKTKAET